MVKATLEERKTQTRRIIKKAFKIKYPSKRMCAIAEAVSSGIINAKKTYEAMPKAIVTEIKYGGQYKCPYGKAGDKLWVRENFTIDTTNNNYSRIVGRYICDNKNFGIDLSEKERTKYTKWKNKVGSKSKIFMFKSLSRITLEITDIRVERVQDITDYDACYEGIDRKLLSAELDGTYESDGTALKWFIKLWDSINKKRGYGWKINPWVWVIIFKIISRIKNNIKGV